MTPTPDNDHSDTMKMRSAVDAWLVLLLVGSVLGVLLLAAQVIEAAPLQGVGALLLAFIATSVVLMRGYPCYYALTDDALLIRGGIERWRIPYANITQIQRTWSPQGGPAWSARRLRIRHSKGSEQISPLDREQFETELTRRVESCQPDSEV